jgi:DNA-binding transcriptional MerR regulator
MFAIIILCTIQRMQEDFFTSTDAALITGCTPRQLQYWRMKGVVVPTVNTTGTGRNVYYSMTDLLQLTSMQYLLSTGLNFDICQGTLDLVKKLEPHFFKDTSTYKPMKKFMLLQLSIQNRVELSDFNEDKAIAAIRSGRAVIPFWTELVKEELEKRIKNFQRQQIAKVV